MFSTIVKKASLAPALAVLTGSFIAVPAAHASELTGPTTIIVVTSEYWPAQLEATDLLKEVRANAIQLSKESDQLASLTRLNVSRETYAGYLDRVKAHINKTGQQLAFLEELKNEATPWQQQAIDRITPVARQIAANTEAAIRHINETPNVLFSQSYRGILQAIADNAHRMQDSVSNFLNLAAAQQKVDDLQLKILASSNS